MDVVEKYELISKIGYIGATVFLLISIILFFLLKIVKVLGYITGIARKKAISKIRKRNKNANFFNTTENIIEKNEISKTAASKFEITGEQETTLLDIGEQDTLLLSDKDDMTDSLSEVSSKAFIITKDITFIHTNIIIT